MSKFYSPPSLRRFFYEIYNILRESNKDTTELWYEIPEINYFKKLDDLDDFLNLFEFIKKERGNYINYVVINKILFVMESIKYLEFDIKKLSELLDFNSFEELTLEILLKHDYFALKNFRFSDRSNFKSKTSQKRYEIDVIGLKRNYMLIIDAKQWRRKDSFSSMNKAANLQYRRVLALKNNPEVFSKLIQDLLGVNPRIEKYLPIKLVPLMVTLEDNGTKLNSNQIPLVSISQFNSFLEELQYYLHYYKTEEIRKVIVQKQLL